MEDDRVIDLGVDHSKMEGPAYVTSEPATPSKKSYPRFHYSGPEELDLPDSGKMEIRFRKASETYSRRDDGSKWYECSVEVKEIMEVEDDSPEAPSKRDTSAEDALDELAEAKQKEKERV